MRLMRADIASSNAQKDLTKNREDYDNVDISFHFEVQLGEKDENSWQAAIHVTLTFVGNMVETEESAELFRAGFNYMLAFAASDSDETLSRATVISQFWPLLRSAMNQVCADYNMEHPVFAFSLDEKELTSVIGSEDTESDN